MRSHQIQQHKTKITLLLLCSFLFTPALGLAETTFIAPTIKAESAVIYDPSTNTFLYQKNGDEVRSIASIIKIMTAMVAKDILGWRKMTSTSITIDKLTLETIADRGLHIGEKWDFNDFLHFMLITSSNTAADNISKQLVPQSSFLSLLNFKAKQIGVPTIHANTPSGLPIMRIVHGISTTTTPGAVGSANDVAKLLAYEITAYPDLVTHTSTYNASFTAIYKGKLITHDATSTDQLLLDIPEILGGKTGYTDLAGGVLSVILNTPKSKPVIIVVLGSTIDGRFEDVRALASSTLQYYFTNQ